MNKLMLPIALFSLFAGGDAFAHEAHSATGMTWKYDGFCCNGNSTSGDCQSIPAKTVKVIKGGYQVTLNAGDHRLVTRPHTFFVKQEDARVSKDDDYHACLFPTEDTLRCFYAPPPSF